MSIKQTKTGWQVDIQLGYQGKRIRKTFKKSDGFTKADALNFERSVRLKAASGELPSTTKARLSDLVQSWYRYHGISLKDGAARLANLNRMIEALGNPRADKFTGTHFTQYREQRLKNGTSPNTVNHEHAYLRAVFNELSRSGECKLPNPLANIRKLKIDETELSYLCVDDIQKLFAELQSSKNPDVAIVAEICLVTGARWSEAEGLAAANIKQGRITYTGTKSGKNRSIPINSDLYKRILAERPKRGRLFRNSYEAFRSAMDRSKIELPAGQCSHVLRHTFASHFVMNGGNILTLQKILGHADIKMTLRYAHLAEDHLDDALKYNPLANIDTLSTLRNVG